MLLRQCIGKTQIKIVAQSLSNNNSGLLIGGFHVTQIRLIITQVKNMLRQEIKIS